MRKNRIRIKSQQIIPLGFIGLILIGMLLLMLPFSTAPGETTTPLTALFTSTTCVCVTGLVVVDTFSHWSAFGQVVLMILIQFGGLGIVAVMSTVILVVRRRISMEERVLLTEAFSVDNFKDIHRFLRFVLVVTFVVEGIGALLYSFYFVPVYGAVKGIWVSVFLAVSAFCNAGIDLMGASSLIPYQTSAYLLTVTMLLIIAGGIGYVVYLDIYEVFRTRFSLKKRRPVRLRMFSEHTRLVVLLTLFLIFGGAAVVFALEHDNYATIGEMGLCDKILNCLFQSVTFRTAGFASVPQTGLHEETTLFGDILMFIGGSPIGTAGGVKTITFFFVLVNAQSFIKSRRDRIVFKRRISPDLIRKSTAIVTISLTATLFFSVLLVAIEDVALVDGLYEVFSAIGTVGLSRDLTSSLHNAGRIILIICMYLGRIGPISMALFFNLSNGQQQRTQIAEGRFYVG